jgi:hypothetical protein
MHWLALLACTTDDKGGPGAPEPPACGIEGTPDWRDTPGYARDGELTWADIQARGTHNSYHQEPDQVLDASHAYTQPPLDEQLADLGVRQIELDLHRREGGGFDVFHLPGIDPRSSCPTLEECLAQLCVWSAGHPEHVPALVWFEPKDDLDALTPGYDVFDGGTAELEAAILDVFPRDRIYAPDDWKRGEADLGSATAALGPPTLGEVRGKTVFALLDSDQHRADYLAESPDLTGRLLFPDADDPTDSFAALRKDAGPEEMPALLAAGLVVTDYIDAADHTDEENAAERDAGLASGLQYASSDYPAPIEGRDYWMDLPAGDPVACNPVAAPTDCVAEDVE